MEKAEDRQVSARATASALSLDLCAASSRIFPSGGLTSPPDDDPDIIAGSPGRRRDSQMDRRGMFPGRPDPPFRKTGMGASRARRAPRENSPGEGFRHRRGFRGSRFACCLGLLTAVVALCAPTASAQTPPTVTLSVPANTELAEGEGNTTVTVTATLSAARSANTVVDLTLGGTAKSTDYGIVGSLPDITIPDGQTVGTADVTLSPVDDSFFEGEETIGIGGTVAGLTVSGVNVPLADNEQPPTLQLQLSHEYEPGKFRLFSSSTIWDEGDEATIRIAVLLSGGSVFEEDRTVAVAHDARPFGASLADINFGSNGPPWSIEIQAGSSAGSLEGVSFTIVDDTDTEFNETFVLKAEVSAVGTDFSAVRGIRISESDQPVRFDPRCNSTNFVNLYPGESRKLSCHIKEFNGKKATRNYTVTFTPEDASLIDPDSLEFEVKSGQTSSGRQDITFIAGMPQNGERASFLYNGTVVPNDGGELATNYFVTIYPSIDSSYQIDDFTTRSFSTYRNVFRTNDQQQIAQFTFPRPIKVTGPAEIEIILDSGIKTVPCNNLGDYFMNCLIHVAEGDYDFDGMIEIPVGAVKFTGWQDVWDTSITGTVASPLPAMKMSVSVDYTIYGGSHAVELRVSPQTLQEGVGEQMLTVTAQNAIGETLAEDLVIPLVFTDISTSSSDYSVRGTPSVTIPAGKTEGSATVHFTPADDLVREARVETVRIEGSKGAMMTPLVQGAELRLLDAAGIRLSASPGAVTEGGGAQQVTVTAEWGDAGDSALARDVEVSLAWGGTAGSSDYVRSGGTTVTIPANARSGSAAVTITPTDDKLLEGDETITISGSTPGRAVAQTEMTLTDDETVPAVSIAVDTNAVQEGGSAQTVTVSATLDPVVAMANDVTTVTLGLGGTATGGGTDYTSSWSPSTPEITIPVNATEGSNTVSLTLTPVDDQSAEGDETIVVQGTATTESRTLVVKVATIALEDDDEPGVNVSPGTLTVAEGATGTYEVWLGTRPASDVTVSLSSTDGTVATVNKSELTFTPTTWDTRQEVTLTGEEDDRNNADDRRIATIRHTAGGGGYDDVEAAEVSVIVTDNDEAASFSIGDASVTEGQTASFTVTRRGATGDAATVAWSTAEDADGDHPASSADYTAQTAAQTLSFTGGGNQQDHHRADRPGHARRGRRDLPRGAEFAEHRHFHRGRYGHRHDHRRRRDDRRTVDCRARGGVRGRGRRHGDDELRGEPVRGERAAGDSGLRRRRRRHGDVRHRLFVCHGGHPHLRCGRDEQDGRGDGERRRCGRGQRDGDAAPVLAGQRGIRGRGDDARRYRDDYRRRHKGGDGFGGSGRADDPGDG